MQRLLALLICATLGWMVAGCGDDASTPRDAAPPAPSSGAAQTPTAAALEGQRLKVATIDGRELDAASQLTIAFDDGRLIASVGCNTISGALELDGSQLRQATALTTEMACGDGVGADERWLSDWLAAGVDATLAGETLTLTGDGVTIALTPDERRAGPPPIVGTRWELISTTEPGGDPVDVPPAIRAPTLELAADGTVQIFTGCNQARGDGSLEDGFLVLGPLAATRRACRGDAGELERTVLAVLDGKAAAAFEGDNLSLANAGRRLTFAER